MTFISYAQNFEDVMLWRALQHIENGFYVDVGAWSPDMDSVTRAFYETGWSGINIEPNPEYYQQLVERRPRDTNLQLAVGDQEGKLAINFLYGTGLSTAVDAYAAQHQETGWTVDRQTVSLTTLSRVFQEYVPTSREIHFVKIDVEGMEEAVIRGCDWQEWRPWIVLIEATLPSTQTESYASWEPLLLASDYVFAYADGLNRFYVAQAHSELLAAFKYPPNVFDGFLWAVPQDAKAEIERLRAQALDSRAQILENASQIQSLKNGLAAIQASISWRITAPLRRFGALLKRWFG